MKARVEVLPRAVTQAQQADAWWREHRFAARELFAQEWADALRLLCEQPDAGRAAPRPHFRRLRVLLLARTRYHVYYEHDEAEARVLVRALWSAVRGQPPRLG